MDEDEALHEVILEAADENKSLSPLKQCLKYKRKKLALTVALLSKAAIGNTVPRQIQVVVRQDRHTNMNLPRGFL